MRDARSFSKVRQKYITNAMLLAMTAVWVALLLASAWIPAYPVLGTAAVITFSSILLSGLTATLLGPLWGILAGFTFGWLVPYVNPATSAGLLTFLGPTLTGLMGGLVLFNRWKEATLVFALQMTIWFLHPFAWYQAMPLITWQSWLVLFLIVVPPVRKWIVNTIFARDPRRLPIALWCLAWIARIGGDVMTTNNNYVWVLGWGIPELYPYWAPMTAYYAVADSLNALAAAIIGTAVLLALKRANLRMPILDSLKPKVE